VEDACDYCANLAEDKAYSWGDVDDIRIVERQFEAYWDRLGGAS
jgi:hypothetical protein